MKRCLMIVAALMLPLSGWAAGVTYPNDKIDIDWSDKVAMQRGARTFVNYCLSCHSARFSRYDRVGRDLEIPEDVVIQNLIFTTDANGDQTKVGELMKTTMTQQYAEQAFGVAPPDLSLVARSRGVDWLYNYLRGFYIDESSPLGMNNGVFTSVAMPHVLVELQGYQKARKEMRSDGNGEMHEVIVGFDLVKPGSQTKAEFDATVHDLVAFLDYLAEPYKQTRKNVGTGVLIFLFLFLILAYFLKKEFWKDIH